MPTLNWIGKEAVVNHHQQVPFRLLKDVPELACGEPGSGNLIVQGDNLVALKALLPYYAGQVKCIYIDPPYNTGNEGWAYNDNVNSPVIREWLGKVVGGEGETLDRHDRWLCMMYPRLALLRQFLNADGSIFVSLDDNEIGPFRLLMDEIFGSQNFVASIAWRSSDNSNNDAKRFSSDYNHTVVYSRNPQWRANRTMEVGSKRSHFRNPDNDPRGPWFDGNPLNSPNPRVNLTYDLPSPTGHTIKPPKNGWRWSRETLLERIQSGEIRFTADGTAIRRRTYLADMKGLPPSNLWVDLEETGHNRQAKYELMEIFATDNSKAVFSTPKPTRLLQRILEIASAPGDIILDSFAGSGTTGHAILKLNAAHPEDSPRRFVTIEIESDVARNVTFERLRRVVCGYRNAKNQPVVGLGGGFRFCELGETLFDETGKIRDAVSFAGLARHVYFTETGEPLPQDSPTDSPFVGACRGVGVYLLYNGILGDKSANGGNILTRAVLAKLPPFDGQKVIYGAGCLLGKDRLAAERILFKQTPYEIRVS